MKNIGIIKRISHLLPQHILKNLYSTLIYPYLTYCNLIWTATYPSHLVKLQILQKKVVRIITNSAYNTHTKSLFTNLNLLNIEQIKQIQIGELMYRYDKNLLPLAFISFFSPVTQMILTRNKRSYICPYARTNIRKFSIGYQGPLLWNNLPITIKHATGFPQFKKLLRAYIKMNV